MQTNDNLDLFREALQPIVAQRLLPSAADRTKKRMKGRKNEIKPVVLQTDDSKRVAELVDFIEYLADEIFESLPEELRNLSFAVIQDDGRIAEKYALPLPSGRLAELQESLAPSVLDSLITYNVIANDDELERFIEPLLSAYIASAVAVPPEHAPSDGEARPEGCEICDRTQLPLTYHHLIPRSVHHKVVKRGWHSDWELNKVAWLCRACHSFVHKIATNEELARSYYDVELLLEREDVQKWAAWASRIRWKAR